MEVIYKGRFISFVYRKKIKNKMVEKDMGRWLLLLVISGVVPHASDIRRDHLKDRVGDIVVLKWR